MTHRIYLHHTEKQFIYLERLSKLIMQVKCSSMKELQTMGRDFGRTEKVFSQTEFSNNLSHISPLFFTKNLLETIFTQFVLCLTSYNSTS